jgi:hypothetical protein
MAMQRKRYHARQSNDSTSLSALALASIPGAGYADAIDDLPPGHWYKVPDSKLRSVVPDSSPGGNTGFRAIITAWSGGSYDSVKDRLIVWGGGHADYAGNELYVFDLNTLKWARLTDPSTPSGGSEEAGVYGDGRPRSTHTNGVLSFSPETRKFYFFGMPSVWKSGVVSHHSGRFNFDANDWESISPKPVIGKPTNNVTAYDSATGLIWVHAGSEFVMMNYDPIGDSWTTFDGHQSPPLKGYATAAIAPENSQMVAVGDEQFLVWNLNDPTDVQVPSINGPSTIVNARAPGFVYDSASKQYVGWSSGANVFTLDPDSLEWRQISPASANSVVPTDPATWGTYGRFQYSPGRNVFVVVNSIDEDVYVYRLSEGTGNIKPNPPENLLVE